MQIEPLKALFIIFLVGGITFLSRAVPFIFFGKGTPARIVLYLGKVLPYAVMAMLIIYCLRNTTFLAPHFGLPEVIGVLVVSLLHIWKKSTIVSVFGGTAVYMLCVQVFFV